MDDSCLSSDLALQEPWTPPRDVTLEPFYLWNDLCQVSFSCVRQIFFTFWHDSWHTFVSRAKIRRNELILVPKTLWQSKEWSLNPLSHSYFPEFTINQIFREKVIEDKIISNFSYLFSPIECITYTFLFLLTFVK